MNVDVGLCLAGSIASVAGLFVFSDGLSKALAGGLAVLWIVASIEAAKPPWWPRGASLFRTAQIALNVAILATAGVAAWLYYRGGAP